MKYIIKISLLTGILFVFCTVGILYIKPSNAGVYFIQSYGEDGYYNQGEESYNCPSNYKTCSSPQIGVGSSCGGKYINCMCPAYFIECESSAIGTGASCDGKYQACQCSNEYSLTMAVDCPSPLSVSGDSCDGKYKKCDCPDTWVSSCTSPKVLKGGSCQAITTSSTGAKIFSSTVLRERCDCPDSYTTCTSPLVGVGTACDGKYASCKCPSSFMKCTYGKAVGATECTDHEGEKFTQCKSAETPEQACIRKINEAGYTIYAPNITQTMGNGFVIIKSVETNELPGAKVFGPAYFTQFAECNSLATPTLTIKGVIENYPLNTKTYSDNMINNFSNEALHLSDIKLSYNLSGTGTINAISLGSTLSTTPRSKINNVEIVFNEDAAKSRKIIFLKPFNNVILDITGKNKYIGNLNDLYANNTKSYFIESRASLESNDEQIFTFHPNTTFETNSSVAVQLNAIGKLIIDNSKLDIPYLYLQSGTQTGKTGTGWRFTGAGKDNDQMLILKNKAELTIEDGIGWIFGGGISVSGGSVLNIKEYSGHISTTLVKETSFLFITVSGTGSAINFLNGTNKVVLMSTSAGKRCSTRSGDSATICFSYRSAALNAAKWKCCNSTDSDVTCGAQNNVLWTWPTDNHQSCSKY